MKNMVKILALLFLPMMVFADIQVSDVKVFSGLPWHEVAIGYTITGIADETFGLQISATDNVSGNSYECKTLEGVSLTEGRHIVKWNASADGVKIKSDNVVFTVKVCKIRYCVVDLSGGTSATSYPVTELMDMPSGGWTDEYKTTKLVLRCIEAGTFIMGSDQANETHRVTLTKPFYMGVFEVTQKQWSLVMGSNPNSSNGKGDKYPVYNVSYGMICGSSTVDATGFLGKLKAKTGLDFDLPTEAQWEYACRAGTSTTYYWGDAMSSNYAWYYSNSSSKTHPVGAKLPNAWGLYDMSGNVREWTRDWYSSTLSYGADPKGPSSGEEKVLRGGCWSGTAVSCQSSYRDGYASSSSTFYNSGFRLVRNLSK